MQVATDAMAGVVLHHRIAMGLDVVLNGASDIQQAVARLDAGQTLHERFLGHPGEPLGLLAGPLAHTEADAAIAVVALEVGTRVDLDQVASTDHPFAAGDAMDDLMVDRGADAGGKAVVALKAGGGSHLPDPLLRVAIQVGGGHARCGELADLPQHGGHDPAGLAHDRDFAR